MIYHQSMHLELSGATAAGVVGNVIIELPGYMTMLQPAELVAARGRGDRIVAAGFDPESGNIVIVTGTGSLLELDTTGLWTGCVDRKAVPFDHGTTVVVEAINTYSFDASWLIQRSKPLVIAEL